MRQIRARIREKRGVDYTEEQIRELAKVKLEKFLDPHGGPLGPGGAVPPRAPGSARAAEVRVRGHDAVRIDPRRHPADPAPAAAGAEAVLQPEPAHPGAPYPERHQRDQRAAVQGTGRALLRGAPQPRARTDAAGHRDEEPEDAARVDLEPARLRRTPRARARGRRPVPAGDGRGAGADGRRAAGRRNRSRRTRNPPGRRRRRPAAARGGGAGGGAGDGTGQAPSRPPAGADNAGAAPAAPPADTASAQTGPPSSGDGPGEGSDASGL